MGDWIHLYICKWKKYITVSITGEFFALLLYWYKCLYFRNKSILSRETDSKKKWDNAEKRVMPDEKNVMQFLFGATTNTVATRTSAHLNWEEFICIL